MAHQMLPNFQAQLAYDLYPGLLPESDPFLQTSADAYPDISLADIADRGMQADIKHFYRKDGRSTWKEWAPDNDELDAERSRNAKFALIVRREQDNDSESGLGLQSFTIQSPLLRELMQEVFDDYPSVNTKLKQITFNRPFYDFFYRFEKYEACAKAATDPALKEHIALLDGIVKPEFSSKVELKKELERENAITFDFLWTLFEPDSEVYTGRKNDESIYLVKSCAYSPSPCDGTPILQLFCRFVDCDGSSFGFRGITLEIRDFKGTKSISELNVVPLKLHPEQEHIVQRLSQRGKQFQGLQGVHYMSYHGIITPAEPRRKSQMVSCDHMSAVAGLN